MNKTILWILIVLLILAGGYFLYKTAYPAYPPAPSPTPALTASFKTYTNDKFGIEFRYPKEVPEDCRPQEKENAIIVGNRISINISDSKGLNLNDFAENDIKESLADAVVESKENAEVGGQKAIRVNYRTKGVGRFGTVTYVINNTKAYTLSFLAGGECPQAHNVNMPELDILNQALLTLKFLEAEDKNVKPFLIGPSATWSQNCTGECFTKWHECGENLDCIYGVMKRFGASPDAITFTKILSETAPNSSGWGYLKKFQEMGNVDLGSVFFPNRANFNEEPYLLNGTPLLFRVAVIPEADDKEIDNEMKNDPLFPEMKAKYPQIDHEYTSVKFTGKRTLPNGGERFIFQYAFVNGCRVCFTEYFVNIGYEFDSKGKFLKAKFLEIIAE